RVNLVFAENVLRTADIPVVEKGGKAARRGPVDSVVFHAKVFDDALVPRPEENGALVARHSRASGVVDAEIPFYQAISRHISGAEHGDAVALCVVPVTVEHGIARVAPIDVECAAVDARTIRQKRLASADHAVRAHPGPDSVGSADRLRRLHAGVPRGAGVDQAVLDAKKNDAVAVEVVHRGIADDDVRTPVLLRDLTK